MNLYTILPLFFFLSVAFALECYVGTFKEHHLEDNKAWRVCYGGFPHGKGHLVYGGTNDTDVKRKKFTDEMGLVRGMQCETSKCNFPNSR